MDTLNHPPVTVGSTVRFSHLSTCVISCIGKAQFPQKETGKKKGSPVYMEVSSSSWGYPNSWLVWLSWEIHTHKWMIWDYPYFRKPVYIVCLFHLLYLFWHRSLGRPTLRALSPTSAGRDVPAGASPTEAKEILCVFYEFTLDLTCIVMYLSL